MSRKTKKQNSSQSSYVSNLADQCDDSQAQVANALRQIFKREYYNSIALHGNCKWKPSELLILAVTTTWLSAGNLSEAFKKASRFSSKQFGFLATQTFQGMMRAFARHKDQLLSCFWQAVQIIATQQIPEYFRIGGFVALAIDGTGFGTSRTRSNEKAFVPKRYGKGKKARSKRSCKNKKGRKKQLVKPKPQVWTTMLWHVGFKLPWFWKLGPSNSSERSHCEEMIKEQNFPEKTLFIGDAGFTGYPLWTTIIGAGHNFLVRVGANIHLLRELGTVKRNGNIVWFWPKDAFEKKLPPLELRLIRLKDKRGTIQLLTNVLSERTLSQKLALKLYTLRWGIEVQYRTVKQTFDKGTLLCRNSDHTLSELHMYLMTITILQLSAGLEQTKINIDPERTSVAMVIRVFQDSVLAGQQTGEPSFVERLKLCVKDDYKRASSKKARYIPTSSSKPSKKRPPVIKLASKEKKAAYAKLELAALAA